MREEVSKNVVEWKEGSSRLMWVKEKYGSETWAFVCAYGPGSERSEAQRESIWKSLEGCVKGMNQSMKVVLLGNLIARV